MNAPWLKYVTWENLPNPDMKILARVIGLEATCKVMNELEGVCLNIPQKALNTVKLLYVFEKYDGTKDSRVLLAQTTGLSENYILKAIQEKIKKNRRFE